MANLYSAKLKIVLDTNSKNEYNIHIRNLILTANSEKAYGKHDS